MGWDGGEDGDEDVGLLFMAFYGLKLDTIEDGSEEAKQMKAQYTAMARNTCLSVRDKVRTWKEEGTLDYE